MLNVLEFKAAMVRKGFTQKSLAQHLGISEKTLCSRIKNKRFSTEEIEQLIPLLGINNPMQIFLTVYYLIELPSLPPKKKNKDNYTDNNFCDCISRNCI